jgi:hypothetical protein
MGEYILISNKTGSLLLILIILGMVAPAVPSQDISPVVLSNIELVTVDEATAAITWVTNLPADTRVQWGETDTLGDEVVVDETELYHMGHITDLEQGTLYYYRIGSDGRWSATSTFTTLTAPGSSPIIKFAIVADTHYDTDGQNTAGGAMYEDSPRLTASLVAELNQDTTLDFVVTLGDNTNGAESDYEGFTATLDGLNVPWYPLLGNWDKQEAGWRDYHVNITGWSETYYLVEEYSYNVIVLDSAVVGQIGGSIDEEQFEWLEATLDENFGVPTLIFMHHMADRTDNFGIDEVTKSRLENILATRTYVLGLYAGHLHKNLVTASLDSYLYITTAAVVSYPIGYSVVKLYENGYTQSFHKLEDELAASEESRLKLNAVSGGNEDEECLGTIDDRSLVVNIPTAQAPTVTSIIVSPTAVPSGGTADVTVSAHDPNGDELTYLYDTSGGSITGSGTLVTYQAPQTPGRYTITVQAFDGEYYSAVKSANVEVGGSGVNQPPQLTKFKASSTVARVDETVTLEATAFDADGDSLTYHYDASGGTLSGRGAEVEWRAPGQTGEYTISAWVSDDEFESSKKEVTITVIESLKVDEDEGIPGFEAGAGIIGVIGIAIVLFTHKRKKH